MSEQPAFLFVPLLPAPENLVREQVMTERERLWRAVCAEPEDDTVRLAFADWLEENSETKVPCPHCGGGRPGLWAFKTDDDGRCTTCGKRGADGEGLVSDCGNRDLAEFIRLAYRDDLMRTGNSAGDMLHWRERELLKSHPEWLACLCPACGGAGRHEDSAVRCGTCGGAGDLFKVLHFGPPPDPSEEPTVLEDRDRRMDRGLVDSLSCASTLVWRHEDEYCPTCTGRAKIIAVLSAGTPVPRGWDSCGDPTCNGSRRRAVVPAPWALAVAENTAVTRFAVTDVRAAPLSGGKSFVLVESPRSGAYKGRGVPESWYVRAQYPSVLTPFVRECAPSDAWDATYSRWEFDSEAAANGALHRACSRWVRSFGKGKS